MLKLEDLLKKYKVHNRLQTMDRKANYAAPTAVTLALEVFNKHITECMLCAEKGCQKLRFRHYEVSPPVKSFLNRCHVF